jgi:hypothetical protein
MNEGRTVSLTKKDLIRFDKENLTIPLASDEEIRILKKVSLFPKLIEIARCYEGEVNLTFHKKYLRKEKDNNAIMIKGAAVQKWHIKEKMSQGEIEYLDVENYLNENSGPKTMHHTHKRIVMQGITGVDETYRLKMTLVDKNIFCGNSVNYILIDKPHASYEYLLAILNSTLLNWYFKVFSTNSNVNGYEVNNFPIPKIPISEQKRYKDIVDKILAITKPADYWNDKTKQAKVRDFESQLDELVYSLYGLIGKEIKIVEGNNTVKRSEFK